MRVGALIMTRLRRTIVVAGPAACGWDEYEDDLVTLPV